MATVSASHICSTCNKTLAKYVCTGCGKYFCPKDFKQHDQELSARFDKEIVRSHDELLDEIKNFEKSNDLSSDIFDQIEQWRKITIEKVEKAAERASHELSNIINKQRMELSKRFAEITKEIRTRQEEENFVETDIVRLRMKINKIQGEVNQFFRKSPTKTIVFDNDEINWDRIICIRGKGKN